MRLALVTLTCSVVVGVFCSGCAEPRPDVEILPSPERGADNWPRWRGPSGQGIVDDGHDYTSQWSETANVLWKTEVGGFGFSSPVVWDDRIFLTTATPEPDGFWPANGGDRRSVLCFKRTDGTLLWETVVPSGAKPEKTNPHNGHASSTPATDGERLYAYFGNHGLLALDLDGNVLWHRKVGPFNAFQGTASSPLLHGDKVILSQDHRGKSGSFIAAFDKLTGEPIWRTERTAEVGWGTPVAIRAWGREQIVLSSSYEVISYEPGTGAEIWRAKGTTVETIPTPVVGESLLFCSSGRAGPTLAIRPDGSGDVTETHIAWQSPKGSPYVASPVLHDGVLYMVNDTNGVATAYQAASGEVLWQARLGKRQRGQSFYASPIAVNDKIYFTDDSGDTYVVRAGRDFELLRVNSLNDTTRASPALVDGIWYIRTQRHLYAIAGSDEVASRDTGSGEIDPTEASNAPPAPVRRASAPPAATRGSEPVGHTAPSDSAISVDLTPAEKAEGFVKLGNRRDLSDFILVGASPDSCVVEEDVIRCKGHPAGYFATKESYENYLLRLDVRFPGEIGNGGFLLHIDGEHRLWPRCVEVQGHYMALGRVFATASGGAHGPRADNAQARKRAILPSHEWNSLEILSRRGMVQTFINGSMIVSFGPLQFTAGPIGIQLEGADIEFRNIRIRRDAPTPAPQH